MAGEEFEVAEGWFLLGWMGLFGVFWVNFRA